METEGISMYGKGVHKRGKGLDFPYLQHFERNGEKHLATQNCAARKIMYGKTLMTYELPGVDVLYIGGGAGLESTASHLSDLVGALPGVDVLYIGGGAGLGSNASHLSDLVGALPGVDVLYIGGGAGLGSTASHLSDLVGADGHVYILRNPDTNNDLLKIVAKDRFQFHEETHDCVVFGYDSDSKPCRSPSLLASASISMYGKGGHKRGRGLDFPYLQHFERNGEKHLATQNYAARKILYGKTLMTYELPGVDVLYIGRGAGLGSTASHLSDLVGADGRIYVVPNTDTNNDLLENVAKERFRFHEETHDCVVFGYDSDSKPCRSPSSIASASISMYGNGGHKRGRGLDFPYLQHFERNGEKHLATQNYAARKILYGKTLMTYELPGVDVLYIGRGAGLGSTASHLSDVVGADGHIYVVPNTDTNNDLLENVAKESCASIGVFFCADLIFFDLKTTFYLRVENRSKVMVADDIPACVDIYDDLQREYARLRALTEAEVEKLRFESHDEGVQWYIKYGKAWGFSVRKDDVKRDKNDVITKRNMVCNAQGERRPSALKRQKNP
ncbi:hypothetical protein LINPERHAP2_LOCUS41347 [Linum perenne]